MGLCKTLHVLSIRDNEVYELPEELGYLPELKVLDIIGNRIKSLPLSYSHLNLDALWLDSDQVKGCYVFLNRVWFCPIIITNRGKKRSLAGFFSAPLFDDELNATYAC